MALINGGNEEPWTVFIVKQNKDNKEEKRRRYNWEKKQQTTLKLQRNAIRQQNFHDLIWEVSTLMK